MLINGFWSRCPAARYTSDVLFFSNQQSKSPTHQLIFQTSSGGVFLKRCRCRWNIILNQTSPVILVKHRDFVYLILTVPALFKNLWCIICLWPFKVCLKQQLSPTRGCGPPPSSRLHVESQQRTSSTSICLCITAQASSSGWPEASREVMTPVNLSWASQPKHLHTRFGHLRR